LKHHRTRKVVVATLVLGLAAAAAAALVGLTRSAGASAATAPGNTSPPTISGTAQEGQTLKADPGTWSGSTPMDFSYQWRRCNSSGASCGNISKATDNIYTLTSSDVGHTLRVVVTAVNSDGASAATSKATDVVKKAPPDAPRNTKEPFITGTAQEGHTLTANPGSWSGAKPIDFSYRWRRCDAKGGDCTSTSVATQSYAVTSADVDHTLRVLVTATNNIGARRSRTRRRS
jgi:fibronectin type 3 domain-containing protein